MHLLMRWQVPKDVSQAQPPSHHMPIYRRRKGQPCQSGGGPSMDTVPGSCHFMLLMSRLREVLRILPRSADAAPHHPMAKPCAHVTKWKELVQKSSVWYSSNYTTFWKRQTIDNIRSVVDRGWGKWEGGTGAAKGIFRAVKLLCVILWWWRCAIINLLKPTECTTLQVNTNGDDRL